MMRHAAFWSVGLGLLGAAAFAATALWIAPPGLAAAEDASPAATASADRLGAPVSFRRLSEAQYKRSIALIFGEDISVPGRFEPPLRKDGLLAIGENNVSVSSTGFEQYELRAREIASQVMAPQRRDSFLTCKPETKGKFDRICASAFLGRYGRLLYRRPLTRAELGSVTELASASARAGGDFYKGLETGLARLLVSPNFLFRVERLAGGQGDAGRRLDDYSIASRISFLLWDAPPGEELLDAAAAGTLGDPDDLARQVDRMLASPRLEQGVRAFFSDMFAYEQFDALTKDQAIYPKYTSQLARDAEEQALRTIIQLLLTEGGDYRDLFTTRKTFLNRNLGSLYRVPVSEAGVDGWVPYSFPENQPRAGILSLAAFLMLDPTHEGRSSPTIRGKTVRELFLCQPVPPPPPNVNFALLQDTSDPNFKTARQRLARHRSDPVCAGCHSITDPIGLSMENYDAIGAYRMLENGAPIDASGEFEGHGYRNLIEFGAVLRENPATTQCIVQRVLEYATGRSADGDDWAWMARVMPDFAGDGYAIPALLRRVATSDVFRRAGPALAAKD